MRVFIDTEFTDLEEQLGLSIALVAEDGRRECYLEIDLLTRPGEHLKRRCSKFVNDEVLPQFGRRPNDIVHPNDVGSRIAGWILSLNADRVEVIYDYSGDFELLANWLRQSCTTKAARLLNGVIVRYLGGDLDAERAKAASLEASELRDGLRAHHALADARALRAAFNAANHIPLESCEAT